MALELFHFQFRNNPVYQHFVRTLNIVPVEVDSIASIPFMPIQFFKNHVVRTTDFNAETVFESSGTTGQVPSKHFVKSTALYTRSYTRAFELFYGEAKNWCIVGLLPSYLERGNSSLILMMEDLIRSSSHPLSGFYLSDHEKLYHTLQHNEILKQPTLLVGVTYALMDFAEKHSLRLTNTVIMETGGMKGRREELTREEVHTFLCSRLGVKKIHSEYGMTELLSQAYSPGNGVFKCPPWMKVVLRDEDDPLTVKLPPFIKEPVSGVINVIDLANIYSCAFIATDDLGKVHHNGSFEVLGRCDSAEVRGCSLLTV